MTEPKKGWLQRLSDGLSRTSRQMGEQVGVLTKRPLDQAQLDELEEMLIEADLGPTAAAKIAAAFGEQRFGRQSDEHEIKEALAGLVAAELIPRQGAFDPLSGPRPFVVLFVGVNGSGKTTTIGKLAAKFASEGRSVMLAAGDTFRAAAIEQLKVWGERTNSPVIAASQGSDSASLAFNALSAAREQKRDVLLVDTAGRLQNKQDLMLELTKMVRVLRKIDPCGGHGTTGGLGRAGRRGVRLRAHWRRCRGPRLRGAGKGARREL